MSLYLGTTPIADGTSTALLNKKVNLNLDNSTVITNCITYIPQDIKLELNNGTLTLKAGSKVYVPNGFESDGTTPKFDEVVIANDLTFSYTAANTGRMLIAYDPLGSGLIYGRWDDGHCLSGTSTPTSSYYMYYNITDNICYNVNNTTGRTSSFPICSVQVYNNNIQAINQIFNGFGCIGSTIFALPGVKGSIPNGRNEDGSLKSIEFTTSSVILHNYVYGEQDCYFGMINDNIIGAFGKTITFYDNQRNLVKDTYPSTPTYNSWQFSGSFRADSNNRISNFKVYTPFHALDYNDSHTISGWGMPSERYIDLTLGASPATYTAPANGYFAIASTFNQNGILFMYSNSPRYGNSYTYNQNAWTEGVLFVKKGYSVNIQYNGTPSLQYFRFIYAEGEQ